MEIALNYLQNGLSAILPFIILLGLLIFVHEMGHFLVAKYFKVRVEVFSLGFGKKLLSFVRGDTTYCISMIPLGGYVKMYGDDVKADIPEDQKKYSFTHKPVFQRIAIVLAGPMMNLIFAFLIFCIVAVIGEPIKAPIAGDIFSDTPAFEAGFRSGDRIIKAGNVSVNSWEQFVEMLTEHHDENLSVEIKRASVDQIVTLNVHSKLIENPNILSLRSHIGEVEGLTSASKASVVGIKGDSIAAVAGLKTGDIIKSIGDRPVKYFRELDNFFVSLQGQAIAVHVDRYANIENEKPTSETITIPAKQFASIETLGIDSSELYLAKIIDGSPAQAAGLLSSDRILKIQNQKVTRWEHVLNTVKNYNGQGAIDLLIERNGKEMNFSVTPKETTQMNQQGGEEKRYTVGILPWALPASAEMATLKTNSIGETLARGYKKTVEITEMTVLSFLRLIQTKISPKNIGGVLSIGQAASETFKIGIAQFMQMMAIISINLFVLNLLPIPVLDGGHLLFYSIEALRGAPVSMRKMEIAQQIGLVLLMSLMLFSLFNDFSRILSAW
jgi:regulator of sigma E protease